jgi:MFS family permease
MAAAALRKGRRIALSAIAASLIATALLAIGILLFGDFGETEGRILLTTALLAGYALLALPAGFLFDQSRVPSLAATVVLLSAGGLVLALAAIWTSGPSDDLGKSLTTVTLFAVAATQTAALTARRRPTDPPSVRMLFVASCVLALVVAALVTVAVWAEIEDSPYFRIVAAAAVLDVLLVVLQPVVALAQPRRDVYRVHVTVDPGEELETTIEAADFAAAAERAIRTAERDGRRVVRLERH